MKQFLHSHIIEKVEGDMAEGWASPDRHAWSTGQALSRRAT